LKKKIKGESLRLSSEYGATREKEAQPFRMKWTVKESQNRNGAGSRDIPVD
jgi:hypothetical protein